MPVRGPRPDSLVAALLSLLLCVAPAQAGITVTEGTNLAADVSPSGRQLAIDLLGGIWILDADGGQAEIATQNLLPARRPRWSPDSGRILYQTTSALGSHIWLLDVATGRSRRLGDDQFFDQHADWHPDGKRIVYSSDRHGSGFDLWEMELATGLTWRLTERAGDETEPQWSPDGDDLAYIQHEQDQWRLVLRRRGRPEVDLVVSDEPLAAPAWRPDGTLLTFLRRDGGKYRLDMAILSGPPIVRALAAEQDFFLSSASWLDRQHLVYTADGVIKIRNINAWQATELPFRADIGPFAGPRPEKQETRNLPIVDPPDTRRVIRAARLFDGMGRGYREDVDILIDGATVAAVEPRREWSDATVLDVGDVTVLPGFIDIYSSLPDGGQRAAGLQFLSFGVTTVVASGARRDFDAERWATEQTPGPRLLRSAPASYVPDNGDAAHLSLVTIPAAGEPWSGDRDLVQDWQERGVPVLAESWNAGYRLGADLFLGADTLPVSPQGTQYQDVQIAAGRGPVTMVSGLADAGTPGLSSLLRSRQAQYLEGPIQTTRRYARPPDFAAGTSSAVLGSKPNGLPAGLASHAELRALAAAGLSGDEVLWAAGRNAARALGLEGQIGRVAPGAVADLVLVAGDPRARINDALNIVAVVRNGRFYSLVGLLERMESVE